MEVAHREVCEKAPSLLKMELGFPGKADDDIYANASVGKALTDSRDAVLIKGAGIAPAHQPKDLWAAALKRKVKMRCPARMIGYEVQNVVGKEIGLNGREAQTRYGGGEGGF
jgi:TPP-dependent trihydroxycyclohexane-1,2-dione (THcHDO) dehydratase